MSDSVNDTIVNSAILSPSSSQSDVTMYDNILQEIRDVRVLSEYQVYYLRSVSKKKLLRVIELYNVVMRNVNEII